jgi:hypothetical protein
LGSYYVVISSIYGSVPSPAASLTLLYPPSITVNPAGFTASYQSSNSLSVYSAGTPPLNYQWFLNGTNLDCATNSSYNIASLDLTNTGDYTVEVINPYGTVYSSPAYVYMAPSLISPFTGAIGIWGQNTTLAVGAIGSGSLSYQWYFNGVAIPGATGSNYLLNNIQFTNAGLYNVVVSSVYDSVTNTPYQVVVNPANVAVGFNPDLVIQGTVGYSFVIQYSTNLADTNSWTTLTHLVLAQPVEYWLDTSAQWNKPSSRFYRVIPGQ